MPHGRLLQPYTGNFAPTSFFSLPPPCATHYPSLPHIFSFHMFLVAFSSYYLLVCCVLCNIAGGFYTLSHCLPCPQFIPFSNHTYIIHFFFFFFSLSLSLSGVSLSPLHSSTAAGILIFSPYSLYKRGVHLYMPFSSSISPLLFSLLPVLCGVLSCLFSHSYSLYTIVPCVLLCLPLPVFCPSFSSSCTCTSLPPSPVLPPPSMFTSSSLPSTYLPLSNWSLSWSLSVYSSSHVLSIPGSQCLASVLHSVLSVLSYTLPLTLRFCLSPYIFCWSHFPHHLLSPMSYLASILLCAFMFYIPCLSSFSPCSSVSSLSWVPFSHYLLLLFYNLSSLYSLLLLSSSYWSLPVSSLLYSGSLTILHLFILP